MLVKSTKILLFVLLIVFLVSGCQTQDHLPLITVTPTNTATPVPTPLIPDNPFAEALSALGKISSFQINVVEQNLITGETTEQVWQYTSAQPEQFRILASYSSGVSEEAICIGVIPKSQCWGRVGQHPWITHYELEKYNQGFLKYLQIYWEERTIVASEYIPDTNEILVEWQSPISPGWFYIEEVPKSGSTWLQPGTHLPLREISEWHTLNGTLIRTSEAIFSYENNDTSFVIEPPLVTTVTPVPSPDISEEPTLPVHSEEVPFLMRVYAPDEEGEYPGIIVLHGSDGANAYVSEVARQLAQNGYVTLSLCYFGCQGQPKQLKDINIEYIMEAIAYLQERNDVKDDSIGIVGFSRGAELALIVGAINAEVKAVVSIMGSNRVVGAFPSPGIAWLYQGKPLPFGFIPVEQINGPVMLMHGEQDILWSALRSYYMADRLEANEHKYELQIIPNRGHEIGNEADIQQVLNFLQEALP